MPFVAKDHMQPQQEIRRDMRQNGGADGMAQGYEAVDEAGEGGGQRPVMLEREEKDRPEKCREVKPRKRTGPEIVRLKPAIEV